MSKTSDRSEVPAAVHTRITAIFVSLELSRKVWLVTSLSPGAGEKMSKHSVPAGDVAALLLRFAELKRKVQARTGDSFSIVTIQEARSSAASRASAPWTSRPRPRKRIGGD
jgi:transposase